MPPPRSAYIHVPFCSHRCGYCNFTLVAGRNDLIGAFLEALELELASTLSTPQPVETLFLGGGTPSFLPETDLERLLELTAAWLPTTGLAEISCEMNPLDCTPERLRLLRRLGVNRISLGGQSFSDAKLATLERDHTGAQLRAALAACHQQFDNVSLDLIFAAPGESEEQWRQDIEMALSSPIRHLSTYGLTIERGSAFYGRRLKNQLTEVDVDLQLAMYEYAIDTLSQNGWEHYEVSNFARPGHRCRHNEAYWLGEPWWAFGPGAASFLPNPDGKTFRRCVNHRSTVAYIRRQCAGQSPIAEEDEISPEQHLREKLVFGLRRLQGVNLHELSERWGHPVRPLFEPHLSRYLEQNWLQLDAAEQLKLTRPGLLISDSLWPELLAEA